MIWSLNYEFLILSLYFRAHFKVKMDSCEFTEFQCATYLKPIMKLRNDGQ